MAHVEVICGQIRECPRSSTCNHSRFHTPLADCGARICLMPNGKTMATKCKDRGMFPFKTGDRVVFHNNQNGYSIGRNNPLYGTPYFCCGTVIIDGGMRVQWDNGSSNAYDSIDLDFSASYAGKQLLDPNLIFKFAKRLK